MTQYTRRYHVLSELASSKGYSALIAATPENLCYLTGFWGAGVAIVSGDGAKLLTSKLEAERAQQSAQDCEVLSFTTMGEIFAKLGDEISSQRACIDNVQVSTYSAVREKLKGELEIDPNIFYEARIVKDPVELSYISKAAQVIDGLFEYTVEILEPGVTERQVAAKLTSRLIELDCEPSNYHETLDPLIVASGPNGAKPHSALTNRKLEVGDLVVVDLTLRHKAYVADATRTFAVRSLSREAEKVYEAVRQAQELSLTKAQPGMVTGDVDAVAREALKETGYGDYFVHSLGHGVGLEVHEPPYLRIKGNDVLKKGSVVTIEPGAYLPGKFGVRIEDTVEVGEVPLPLNRFTKEFCVTS